MNRLFIRHEGVFLLISAVLLFLLFTPMFMVTGIVWSQTLSNDIEQPVEKWTRAQSPILIQGVKTVPKKNILIIEPGVVIAFEKGASLEVYGTLIASGMDDDNNQIIFT